MSDKFNFSIIQTEDLEQIISQAIQRELSNFVTQNPVDRSDELVTRKEAAELLGISLPTLHEYTTNGMIPAYRLGSRVRFKKSEVLDCLTKVQTKKKF
jgi:excisionase family DNA binding protein